GTSGPWPSPHNNPSSAIINPTREVGEEGVPGRVVLTFARSDYHYLCRLVGARGQPRYLWDCAFREGSWQGRPLTVVAPAVGAPYAVMVLEKLIVLGARLVLALGWCGSLQPRLKIGALVLPAGAVCGDGTSPHYSLKEGEARPDKVLSGLLEDHLKAGEANWQKGPIWTTDAFYRETAELVRHYQSQGILGVDLELGALFTVGRFRGIPVAGLLVVSDELGDLRWRPGYRQGRFRRGRELAARIVLDTAAAWEGDDA
ncbi:MAG: nucleoside phosphorylase, partial [Thermodesulfobacteriota bacterium]